MKKILVLIALSFMTVSTLTAQMKDPQNWVGYEEIMGVKNGLRFYDFDVNLIESSAPANVFWPGDDIRLMFSPFATVFLSYHLIIPIIKDSDKN